MSDREFECVQVLLKHTSSREVELLKLKETLNNEKFYTVERFAVVPDFDIRRCGLVLRMFGGPALHNSHAELPFFDLDKDILPLLKGIPATGFKPACP